MSEFGGLWKHEKTQHAFVGLGSAALAAAVSLTQVRQPNFPERDNKVLKKEGKKREERQKGFPGSSLCVQMKSKSSLFSQSQGRT